MWDNLRAASEQAKVLAQEYEDEKKRVEETRIEAMREIAARWDESAADMSEAMTHIFNADYQNLKDNQQFLADYEEYEKAFEMGNEWRRENQYRPHWQYWCKSGGGAGVYSISEVS